MISIIIVNYRTFDMTKMTIESVLKSVCQEPLEIMVVDNASNDGSLEKLQTFFSDRDDIKWIANANNDGFAKANNLGIKQSQGEYLLLLNSDVKVEQNTFQVLMDRMEALNKVGAIGPKILLPSGKLDHTCKRGFPTPLSALFYFLKLHRLFPNSKVFGHYTATHLDEDSEGEVDALVGAFMLMPRAVLDSTGLLDETFFMYGEDLDLCYRIKEKGYQVIYSPVAQVLHYKGASSSKKSYKLIYEFYRAMWLFYKKHYKKKHFFLINWCVCFGIGIQFLIKVVINFVKGARND